MDTQPKPRRLPFTKRARSLPFQKYFLRSIYWSAAVFILSTSAVTMAYCFFVSPESGGFVPIIAVFLLAIVSWLFGFYSRKRASCPLCKGTPLLDTGASPHQKAVRFFPLNYGTTNLIRSFFTQRFRCQFCGTPFDYLKPFSRGIEYETEKSQIPPCQAEPKSLASVPLNRKNRHV